MQTKFRLWAFLYALSIIYGSVVIGPNGLHFVPIALSDAWRTFLATPYYANGSDQRADWMANLLMFVPMGFLAAGSLGAQTSILARSTKTLSALFLCVIFLLAVKYLQLFFPPRTVSLNYIIAQSSGAAIGVLAFWGLQPASARIRYPLALRTIVIILLEIYAFAYLIFALLPLDFTLSVADLHDHLLIARQYLFSWPGAGRPLSVRLFLVFVETLATVPLGILLALKFQTSSPIRIASIGFLAMSAITALKLLVISGTPYLVAIIFKTAGVLLGCYLTDRVTLERARWCRIWLRKLLPLLVPVYILAVVDVNGLLSPQWRTIAEAHAALNPYGLIPFWHSYIVSKAEAIESQVAHIVMFFPIGVMLSCGQPGRSRPWIAALLALAFALAVELGRWFKPGLQPDFYVAVTAALGAWLAAKLTPMVWRVLENEPLAWTVETSRDSKR